MFVNSVVVVVSESCLQITIWHGNASLSNRYMERCPTSNWVTKVSKLNEVEYPQNWISTVILLLAHNWKTLEEFWSCMNDFTVAAILILFSCVPLIFFFQHKTTCGRPKEHVGNREDNWMFLHNTAGKFSMGPNLIENVQNRKFTAIVSTSPLHPSFLHHRKHSPWLEISSGITSRMLSTPIVLTG